MQIGKKYWHPELGWVTYEGMDRSVGMYHVVKVLSDDEYTTLDSTTLLFDKPQKFKHTKSSTVWSGRF